MHFNSLAICLFLLLSAPFAKAQTVNFHEKTPPTLTIRVHPGIELMVIVQWLGGRLNMPTDSTYKADAWRTFEKFRGHKAVKMIHEFKNVYPDLTELGWSFDGFPNPKITNPRLGNWEKLFTNVELKEYLESCLDFCEKSGFWKFYQRHEKEYLSWATTIKGQLAKQGTIQKLEGFYGYQSKQPEVQYTICMDPLNNWGAHAIMLKELFSGYENSVVYQLGYWETRGNFPDSPVHFDPSNVDSLFWHEGSHVYIEHLFKKNATKIASLSRLYNNENIALKRQNIANWEYCLNENTVRAVTAILIHDTKGVDAYDKECKQQFESGFIYVKEIADQIRTEFVGRRDKFRDFDEFFSIILKRLDETHP